MLVNIGDVSFGNSGSRGDSPRILTVGQPFGRNDTSANVTIPNLSTIMDPWTTIRETQRIAPSLANFPDIADWRDATSTNQMLGNPSAKTQTVYLPHQFIGVTKNAKLTASERKL